MKRVKNLIIGVLLLVMSSCAVFDEINKNQMHEPPYGVPDDTVIYNGNGYKSITYVYNCYEGRYVAVTFTCTGYNCYWMKSEYTSTCIE